MSARPTSETQSAVLNGTWLPPAAMSGAGEPNAQPDMTIAAQSTKAMPIRLEAVVIMAGCATPPVADFNSRLKWIVITP